MKMTDLVKLLTDKHGGLLILLAVMLLAMQQSHNYGESERKKISATVKENEAELHNLAEKVHDLNTTIHVHIAREERQ